MRAAKQAKIDEVTRSLLGQQSMGYYAAPDPVSRWRRALRRLFPSQRTEPPTDRPYCRTYVDTHFDWKDRLRILVSGRVRTELVVEADTEIPVLHSTAVVYVMPPFTAYQRA